MSPRGAPSKLSSSLLAHVLEHAATGKSSRWIATWCKRSKGVAISHVAIAKHVKEHRHELRAKAKAAVTAKITEALPTDLDQFDQRITAIARELKKVEDRIAGVSAGTPTHRALIKDLARLGEIYRRNIDTKLHYVGADEPDESSAINGVAEFLGLAFGEDEERARAAEGARRPPKKSNRGARSVA